MELLKGRPENAENRLEKEIRVYDLLDSWELIIKEWIMRRR